jgi:Arc/MetJ family transcription regulator
VCWLAKLADKLESVGMRRELVRWPLQAYEELAAEEDDGETDGEDEDEGGRAGLHAEEDVSMGDGVLV